MHGADVYVCVIFLWTGESVVSSNVSHIARYVLTTARDIRAEAVNALDVPEAIADVDASNADVADVRLREH